MTAPPPKPYRPSFAPALPEPKVEAFRPREPKRRLRVLGWTLVTVVALWYLLLERPGSGHRKIPMTPPKPCAAGQTSGCVGGDATVLLLPAGAAPQPSAASAPAGR